jgi:cytochrome c-type biogenesis protein CcmH/NrfG
LLLDRKRINKWAKWVALLLAIVFAAGFLFMGVGYGGAGFNLSELFTGDKSVKDNPQTPEDKIAAYQAQLTQNPKDVAALIGLATVYQQNEDLLRAAAYLQLALEADPSQKELYLRLANIYMSGDVSNYAAAVEVLNKATQVDASNPDVFLKLGTAQNSLGNTEAALLAWQKFLVLAPDDDMATVVQEKVDELSKKPTTTTTSTTSTSGSTATTAAGSSTTATTTP